MRPSAASQQLTESTFGPPDLLEDPPEPAGRPGTAGKAAAADASSDTVLPAKCRLLPCGLTAEELTSLTAQVEARSGSGSQNAANSSAAAVLQPW